jgi:hypothetical protein
MREMHAMTKSPDEINEENSKYWARQKRRRDKQIQRLDQLAGDARTHELARFCKDLTDPLDTAGRQRQSNAGKASGKARRDEAEQTWQPHALSLAIEIQAEDSGILQINLKKQIESRWRLKIPCPRSQLIKAISRWQREGKLARRKIS